MNASARSVKWLLTLLVVSSAAARGESGAARNVTGIMDNSFLVEEAYNQEAGVVQHIFNAFYAVDRAPGPDDSAWNLTFTQEWPIASRNTFRFLLHL